MCARRTLKVLVAYPVLMAALLALALVDGLLITNYVFTDQRNGQAQRKALHMVNTVNKMIKMIWRAF